MLKAAHQSQAKRLPGRWTVYTRTGKQLTGSPLHLLLLGGQVQPSSGPHYSRPMEGLLETSPTPRLKDRHPSPKKALLESSQAPCGCFLTITVLTQSSCLTLSLLTSFHVGRETQKAQESSGSSPRPFLPRIPNAKTQTCWCSSWVFCASVN